MATIEELEARVAALEAASDYTVQQSGETIDAILAGIKDAAIYHGTTEIISDGDSATASATVDLGFAPNANTQIIGSVRRASNNIPTVDNLGGILTFYYYSSRMYAMLTYGPNKGSTQYKLPSGTYYVDWICIDTGEEAS
ncbi:MAG: hypothetical protein IJ555_01705 [Ruminococcus sp.]|nr:hypothetical protein [Ruminococcus sp.]